MIENGTHYIAILISTRYAVQNNILTCRSNKLGAVTVFPQISVQARIGSQAQLDNSLAIGEQLSLRLLRPISLLSVFNRIFEKVMYNRLIAFVKKMTYYINHKTDFARSTPAIMPYSKLSTEFKPIWIISYFQWNMFRF